MKKRYVVAVSDLSADDERLFREYIGENRFGWWHWIDNFWLLTDPSEKSSAAEVRDFLRNLPSSRRCIVMELEGVDKTWSGFGPNSPKSMFEWIKGAWRRD
jgi:hypothetical protein